MFSQPNIFIKTSPSWYVCNSWIFLKSMRWKCEICFPSYCFLLSTKFQLAFIETCDASLGWNKGTRVQPFFFGQTFSLIDWLDFLSLGVGGGGEGGDCKFEVRETRSSIPVGNLIKYPTEAWWSRQGTLPFLLCICLIDKLGEILLF